MLLQKGEYGGKQYFKESTIKEFTKQQFPENKNRRALGFDRQLNQPSESGPCCKSASLKSYGHSGFTGTYFWVDPAYDLIYIFLSNRVNPDANNSKLGKMNIRTEIHEIIYKALKNNIK
jgi:CubicO group peptidase (beta-lactamase class C family)